MLADDFTDYLPDGWVYYLIGLVTVAIIGFVLLIALKERMRCDVCGLPIVRISYLWTIGGSKQRLCPRCSSRMKNKVSKEAFKSKFGS